MVSIVSSNYKNSEAAMFQPTNRRNFLISSIAASTLLSRLQAEVPSENTSSYWESIRGMFPFREEKVPMNSANLCPSPRIVSSHVANWTEDIDEDCSSNNRAKYSGLREEARSGIASQLRVDPDELALVRNTSEANNIINNGFPLARGDEVVLWDQNHPTNLVAWKVRAERFGIQIKTVSTPENPSSQGQLMTVFEQALGVRTKVLAVSHVSNVSGICLPIRELAETAHRRGIYVHVDGAQTWGAFDLNLTEMGCDSYSASSHKWFMGPKEAGILYVKRDWIERLWPSVIAPGWGADAATNLVGARKFESLGQRDDACLAAMGVASDFLKRIGMPRVEARIRELSHHLMSELAGLGAPLVTPQEPELSGGVCIMRVPSDKRRELANRLYQEYGIASAGTGGLRLCPHIYNTEDHVNRALRGVRELRSVWKG